MSSKVTRVKVSVIPNPETKIVALAKVEINGDIVIDGAKIISGSKGLFVGMPSRKAKEEKTWHDVVYASSTELKEDIRDSVLKAYEEEIGSASNEPETQEVEDDGDLPF